jgi:hypothetical protein
MNGAERHGNPGGAITFRQGAVIWLPIYLPHDPRLPEGQRDVTPRSHTARRTRTPIRLTRSPRFSYDCYGAVTAQDASIPKLVPADVFCGNHVNPYVRFWLMPTN